MPFQNKFSTASPILASYSYTDIAEGTGVQIFYGADGENSAGVFHTLSSQVHYATAKCLDTATLATANFDLTAFNKPKTIKGTAVIEGSLNVSANGNQGSTAYVTFTIKHYDGTTYTTIGTVVTQTVSQGNTGDNQECFLINCSLTEKHFAEGDSLRITAVITAAGTSLIDAQLGTDPKNRDVEHFTAATTHTSLLFHIPFKLDL